MWLTKRPSVLIVADGPPDPSIRPAFLDERQVRLLSSAHATAWEVARREKPRVIVDDLRAPNPVALAACRKIRSDRKTRSIPLIAVTRRELEREVADVGADARVLEPVVQAEFFEAVRRFLPLPKRRSDRHAVNLRFSFRAGESRGQCFSRDLSVDGAFLSTDLRPEPGARLDLAFRLPTETREIRCAATVVRPPAEGGPARGVAVFFEAMAEADRVRLRSFLEGSASVPERKRP